MGMELVSYRKKLGLSQEACARALGVTSKGYISDIETGAKKASLRLALRIEQWSKGEVPASSVNSIVAGLIDAKPRRRESGRAA